MATAFLNYIYATALAAGGAAGFVLRGSAMSILVGASVGTAIVLTQSAVSDGTVAVAAGARRIMMLSAVVTAVMGHRYRKTGKLMPAGMVCAMSALVTVLNLMASIYT